MKLIQTIQGSDQWLEHRAKHNNASDAPSMMGCSPYRSRAQLLHDRWAGRSLEVTPQLQKVFDEGHRVEAATRPLAEKLIGSELFPASVTDDDGWLAASLDGMTMDQRTIWECKQANQSKIAEVKEGNVPECDYWQVVQQLLITGAERCLYTVGDGTEEGTYHLWVTLDEKDADRLVAGWKQFDEDLAAYEPPEQTVQATGADPGSLPSLQIQVEGKVLASNLDAYRDHAMRVFEGISTDLSTDQDFADAEATVKWCKNVEDRLESAKEQALGQTASLDELFRAIDDIKATARRKRLDLDKLVKARKQQVRDDIQLQAQKDLQSAVNQANETIGYPVLDKPPADFAGAMKGKRTIASLREAVDKVLNDAKLDIASAVQEALANVKTYEALPDEHKALLPDFKQIATKVPEDFTALVKARIADHEKAIAEREEREKAQREADEAATQKREHKEPPSSDQDKPALQPERVSGPGTKRIQIMAIFKVDVPASTLDQNALEQFKTKVSSQFPSFRTAEIVHSESAEETA